MVLRPTRGGFLRPFGCGPFIREYLEGRRTFISRLGRDVLDEDGIPLQPADPKRGAPTDYIRAAYKRSLLWEQAEDMVSLAKTKGIELSVEEALRRTPKRLTKVRTHSFYRYFANIKALGWVELTGEEEDSNLEGHPGARVERTERGTTLVEIPQPRRYYRLTPKGRAASDVEWADPLATRYGYTKEQRRGTAATLPRPGTLPRGAPRVAPAPKQPVAAPRPKAPSPAKPPPPKPTPPPAAPVGIPTFDLPEKPGRAAAQQLIKHLRVLGELEPEAPQVQAEMERLADEFGEWVGQAEDALSEEENKDNPDPNREDLLSKRIEALEEVQSSLEDQEIEKAITNLEKAFPPAVRRKPSPRGAI